MTREKPKQEKQEPFKLTPRDKTILFSSDVLLQGTVLDREIREVWVNYQGVNLVNNEFTATVQLKEGKNALLIEGFKGDDVSEKAKVRVLRLRKFEDVLPDYWASIPIGILAMENIISGYQDGSFKPEGNITRAELCTLMIKALSILQAPSSETQAGQALKSVSALFPESAELELVLVSEERVPTFKDLKPGHWARRYIVQAVERGIVRGYPDNTFRPNAPVTRAEGVVMLSKFAQLLESKRLEVPYQDVPGRHWAAKDIIKAKEAGMLEYIKEEDFKPNKLLTRSEVAEIISKVPLVAPKIEEMLNWDNGY